MELNFLHFLWGNGNMEVFRIPIGLIILMGKNEISI